MTAPKLPTPARARDLTTELLAAASSAKLTVYEIAVTPDGVRILTQPPPAISAVDAWFDQNPPPDPED